MKNTVIVIHLGVSVVGNEGAGVEEDAHCDDGEDDEGYCEAVVPLQGQEVLAQKDPQVGAECHVY